ncbi:phage holin family protein [Modestobacter sp. L9-4]|uniref:phage holin family protein n=1 Tax=Modestobacter sp. L9-4 TaxID=2851567 RepID=UPI001C769332|nr:phage holin family protein [Modestobacter sp. L9-4]QXG74607.1 phage holin family protein [Modestobacter sp. L9-4]
MSTPSHPGRVLRGGRTLARLLLVWATVTGVLVALDAWLSGFAMDSWWQPPVAALVLGLLAALVWPLVMRIALPVAVFTFGLGSFLLSGGGVLAVLNAIPGVEVRSFSTALVVALAMAGTAGVISSVLAVNEDEVFFRRTRRRGSGTPEAAECPPGVVFLQIDGLGHGVARRAVRDGSMPTLAAWLRSGSHELRAWHTDWSSQTGASQCGILQGSNDDVLGFRWYEKEHDRVVTVSSPGDAAEIERRHSDGRGLLAPDGAGRGNLFTGDAAHVSLTMSSLAVVGRGSRRERRRRDRIGAGYYGYFANPVNVLRTLGVYAVDVLRELSAAAAQRRADVRPRIRRGGLYPLARPATTVLTRDVVVNAIVEDVLAGRPVVYADFVGYDEVAHHSGIERFDALEVLRRIDQQIGRLWRASQLAPRPYHLVCLSDHGQTQGASFADRFGETVEELVGRLAGAEPPAPSRRLLGLLPPARTRTTPGWQMTTALAEAASGGGLVASRLRARAERSAAREAPTPPGEPGAVTRVAPGVVVTVSGHMAMVSFTDHPGRVPLETIERHWPDLLPSLVDHAGIGFMLVHSEEFGPVVLGREGLHRLRTGVVIGTDPLAPYGPHAAALVARGSGFAHCPDIVVNSAYDPVTDEASPFEPHVGSHGALGGPQQHGFLLAPKAWADPGEVVGAEHLHRVLRGWLTDLGHPEPAADPAPADTVDDVPAGARA